MLELSTERESKVCLRIEDYMLKVVLTPKAEERSLRGLLLTQLHWVSDCIRIEGYVRA